ncbi:MAG: hypothetical protein ACYDGR_15820 [Candidatus Dormibacteria bacterium]
MGKSAKAPRAVSVGLDLRYPRVRSVEFGSNDTLLGCDIVLLQLDRIEYAYSRMSAATYMGRRSLDDDGSFEIRADFERRRSELQTVLDLGGTLVVFLPAPATWWVATGRIDHSGTGRNSRQTRMVTEMSLLSLLPFDIESTAATTEDMSLCTGEPFATFWRKNPDRFQAAAFLAKPFGEPAVVIEGTARAVAAVAKVGQGVVIVLPHDLMYPEEYLKLREEEDEEIELVPAYDGDTLLVESLFDLVADLRGSAADMVLPEWASEFVLPGEGEIRAGIRDAQLAELAAQVEGEAARRQLSVLDRRKALFTAEGRALELVAEEALTWLGFDVEEGKPGRADRIARHSGRVAVIEIKGRAKSAAEKDSAQLEKWVNEYHIEHDEAPKGILIVNAWRDKPLDQRTEGTFPDQMIAYAASRKHCLISGPQLLGAWLDAEAHPERRDDIAEAILTCIGRFPHYENLADEIRKEVQSDRAEHDPEGAQT